MYHPTMLSSLAQARHDDMLREASASRHFQRHDRPRNFATRRPVVHPRLVTALVTLLVAFGIAAF